MGRVLVADDETHIVQVLALKFRNAGLEVFEARDEVALRTLLVESGSVSLAYARAEQLVEDAKRELQVFPASSGRDLLHSLADAVVTRTS